MSDMPRGRLIVIGGREEKEAHQPCEILNEVARHARGFAERLALVTVATDYPDVMAQIYGSVFARLGVRNIDVLDVRHRDQAFDPANVAKVTGASVVFMTGGDQWRLADHLRGSPVLAWMHELYRAGGTIAGTSAGATAISAKMIVSGWSGLSALVDDLEWSEGLGFLADAVVDSHFVERKRLGRLIGAVALHPTHLGFGVGENTAMIVSGGARVEVIGSGSVYVLDGGELLVGPAGGARSVVRCQGLRLHALGAGHGFDLPSRRPVHPAR
ncbi:MAG TPA: cyanophycinase [Herpetosiphonaceae bacterium]